MIDAGWDTTCGVTMEGDAYCGGDNVSGEIGDGTTDPADAPVLVAGAHDWAVVRANFEHTCGLTTAGAAYCWGVEQNGRLGNGAASTGTQPDPVPVAGGHTFTSLGVGFFHTCALTDDGAAYCWGYGGGGSLGNGSDAD